MLQNRVMPQTVRRPGRWLVHGAHNPWLLGAYARADVFIGDARCDASCGAVPTTHQFCWCLATWQLRSRRRVLNLCARLNTFGISWEASHGRVSSAHVDAVDYLTRPSAS